MTQCATAALQFLHILASGEAPSTQQLNDALAAINQMLDNWQADPLLALSAQVDSVTLSAGVGTYALATRRSAVAAGSIIPSSGPTQPLKVVNAVQWSQIPDRGVAQSFLRILMEVAGDRPDIVALLQANAFPTALLMGKLIHVLVNRNSDRRDLLIDLAASGLTNADTLARILQLPGQQNGPAQPPDQLTIIAAMNGQARFLFYDRGAVTGTIYLAGPPTTGTAQLVTWTAMTPFADLTTAITMLPGYQRFLELSSALELASQYAVAPDEALMARWQEAMQGVKALNASLLGFGGQAAQGAAPPTQAGG